MGVGEHRPSARQRLFLYFGGFAGTGLHVYVMQGTGILAGTHEGRFFASIGVTRSYNGAKPDAVWRPKQAVHIGVRAGPPRQH